MKYAILLAFAAFAFLAQAEAKTVTFELEGIHDRGKIVDYLRAKLAAIKEKLEKIISKAQDTLNKEINEVTKKVENLIKQLKQTAEKISDKIFETANKILDKLDAKVAESIPEGSHNIEGISECIVMKDSFSQAVRSVIANSSSCINGKIEEAQSYFEGIQNLTTVAVGTIEEIKHQGMKCTRDVSGIKEIAAAILCLTKASAKGTVVVGKTVPAVMLKVARLINEMATLPLSLSLCMPTKALITLGQQVEPMIVSIKDCIKEKVEVSTTPKASTEAQVPQTEQSIEEESPTEAVDEEYPGVQSDFGYEAPVESGRRTIHV